MLHTAGLGFLVGVDIYDCVVVINSYEALAAFSKIRCTLGTEVSAVAGPVGVGGVLDTEVHKRQAPIFSYLKSRGFYVGVQIDGTIVIERTDENERFYGERISVGDIVAGKVRHVPSETKRLLETIRAVQGDTNIDQALLPSGLTPADHEITPGSTTADPSDTSSPTFGIPDKDDPDPFGVLALEKAGLEIRESGSRARPSSEMFSFAPSPTSPIYSTFNRRSIDARSIRSGWSSRPASQASFDKRASVLTTDTSTQTDLDGPITVQSPLSITRPRSPPSPITIPEESERDLETPATSLSSSADDKKSAPIREQSQHKDSQSENDDQSNKDVKPVVGHDEAQETKDINSPKDHQSVNEVTPASASESNSPNPSIEINGFAHHDEPEETAAPAKKLPVDSAAPSPKTAHFTPLPESDGEDGDDSDDEFEDAGEIIEAPVVHQAVQQAATPTTVSRPRIVNVNKAVPPKLPPRNPHRNRYSAPSPTRKDDDDAEATDKSESPASLSPPTERNRHSVDSSMSTGAPVDSIADSIAQLRAMRDDD